jgi:hypothetical protein
LVDDLGVSDSAVEAKKEEKDVTELQIGVKVGFLEWCMCATTVSRFSLYASIGSKSRGSNPSSSVTSNL